MNRPAGAVKRRPPDGPSLHHQMGRAFALAGGVVAVAVLVTGWAVVHLGEARTSLESQLDPARTAARDLHDVVATEAAAAARGPAGQADYRSADAGREAIENDVRRRLGADGDLAGRLSAFLGDTESWRRQSAEPAVTGSAGLAAVSGPAFATLQASYQRLISGLDAARDRASDRVTNALRLLEAVLAVSLLGFVTLGWLLWTGLRSFVLDPLTELAEATREITEGVLDRPVETDGPPEIDRLGFDIDMLRQRIADELDAVMEARTQAEAGAAELARSNSELEQFAHVASHDLQEPLRKIASFCQLIEQRYSAQLDERGKQYIDLAVDGAKRMQRLINELLAFSQVGRTTENLVALDLDNEVREALRVMRPQLAQAGAVVEIGPLPAVLAERGLLGVLLQNLLSNSVKFRGPDPPRIHIDAAASGEGWEIAVRDNGIGIAPQFADRVFVLFQRLNARDSYEGTGVGLAMCRKIVTFHGGRIWVDTTARAGTTVRFTIPDRELMVT